MLVLNGNIPRFPWEPSTTMLIYRLDGTTDSSASYRNSDATILQRSAYQPDAQLPPGERHPIFAHPGEHPRRSRLLICHFR